MSTPVNIRIAGEAAVACTDLLGGKNTNRT